MKKLLSILFCIVFLVSCRKSVSTDILPSSIEPVSEESSELWFPSEESEEPEVSIEISSIESSEAPSPASSKASSQKSSSSNTTASSKKPAVSSAAKPVRPPKPPELRGVWISYVDFPAAFGATEKSFKEYIDKTFQDAKNAKMNAVFVHVRPFADALYPSKYFPWSHCLTGTQGKDPKFSFDPLTYMVDKAHALGLQFHAWLNPFRIKLHNTMPTTTAENNLETIHPEWTLKNPSDGLTFLNPTIPEVRTLVCNGVKEIVDKYDVDGIHFDDYFYGNVASKPEVKGIAIKDFTECVSTLVRDIYSAINKRCEFGISPSGNVEVSEGMGAAVRMWGKTAGYVDYLCPQIYWTDLYYKDFAKYNVVLKRWSTEVVTSASVRLYVGLGIYRVGRDDIAEDKGWMTGTKTIIKDQVGQARKYTENYNGFVLFSVRDFYTPQERVDELNNLKTILN